MCGRYLLDTEIRDIIRAYKIKSKENIENKLGDVYPSNNAPIVWNSNQRTISHARWGFPFGFKKGIVINAKAETIMDKPMFRNSFYTSRCVIPANLYYEWKDEGGKKKVKYGIGVQNKNIISLGGIFKVSMDEKQIRQMTFVIITTEAKEDIKSIHPRMPFIVEDDLLEPWLNKNTSIGGIREILNYSPNIKLTIKSFEDQPIKVTEDEDYQQMKMF